MRMSAKSLHLRNRLRTYHLKLTPRQPSKKLYLLLSSLSKLLPGQQRTLDFWMKTEINDLNLDPGWRDGYDY